MKAIDSSIAVAAFAPWHTVHAAARQVAGSAIIPAHARIETYSLLTRMPPRLRLSGPTASGLLGSWFPPERTLVPSGELSRSLAEYCSTVGVVGGAVYDALVALTAAEAGATLVTADERAANTYRRLGVVFELAT